jgi:hypothetical protein
MSNALELIRAAKAITEASDASGLLAGAARIEALAKPETSPALDSVDEAKELEEAKAFESAQREALLHVTVQQLSEQVRSLIDMQKSVVDALTALASRPVEIVIKQEPITVKVEMPASVVNVTNIMPEAPIQVTALLPARKKVSTMTYDNLDRVKELVQIEGNIVDGEAN